MLIGAIQANRGFKSCPQDRSAATVAAIELLLKGFAGAGFEPLKAVLLNG
jgi:hypothetical protein